MLRQNGNFTVKSFPWTSSIAAGRDVNLASSKEGTLDLRREKAEDTGPVAGDVCRA
jgi:hypothetical protein